MEQPVFSAGDTVTHVVLNHFFSINNKYTIGPSHQSREGGRCCGINGFQRGMDLSEVCFVDEKLSKMILITNDRGSIRS